MVFTTVFKPKLDYIRAPPYGQRCRMLAVYAHEILGIAGGNLQRVIRTFGHQVAFLNIGHPGYGPFKRAKQLIGLSGSGGHQPRPHVTPNDARTLKPLL